MTKIVFFLVLKFSNAAVVIPEPFQTEDECKAQVARLERSYSEGGMYVSSGKCIPVRIVR